MLLLLQGHAAWPRPRLFICCWLIFIAAARLLLLLLLILVSSPQPVLHKQQVLLPIIILRATQTICLSLRVVGCLWSRKWAWVSE
jgi:hypothetical protein